MKSDKQEELIVRWMDGGLNAEEQVEVGRLLESEPELLLLKERFEPLRESLQRTYAKEVEIPYADFFQTRLHRAIREEEEKERTPAVERAVSWRAMFHWWLAPVAAGSLALAFLAGTRVAPKAPADGVAIASIAPLLYTPDGGVTAQFQAAGDGKSDYIVLEGLPALPDSVDLMAKAKKGQGTGPYFVSHKREVF